VAQPWLNNNIIIVCNHDAKQGYEEQQRVDHSVDAVGQRAEHSVVKKGASELVQQQQMQSVQ
jgi:hypothetical protein